MEEVPSTDAMEYSNLGGMAPTSTATRHSREHGRQEPGASPSTVPVLKVAPESDYGLEEHGETSSRPWLGTDVRRPT